MLHCQTQGSSTGAFFLYRQHWDGQEMPQIPHELGGNEMPQ